MLAPVRSTILMQVSIIVAARHIFHRMVIHFLSVQDPTPVGAIVSGGHGSNGICLAITSHSTGATLRIGSSMRSVLVCRLARLRGLARSRSSHAPMAYGHLVLQGTQLSSPG